MPGPSSGPSYAQELDVRLILTSRRELSRGVYAISSATRLTACISIADSYHSGGMRDRCCRVCSGETRHIVCVRTLAVTVYVNVGDRCERFLSSSLSPH